MSVTIRAARSSDSKGMGIVHVRAWQAAYREVMTDDYLDGLSADERAAMWERAISAPAGPHVLVAAIGDEVIGFASFGAEPNQLSGRGIGELYAINLDPAHWGNGIGRLLLRGATNSLRSMGFQEAVLWVATTNFRARSLYDSEGWTDDDAIRSEDVLGAIVQEMRYRYVLTSVA
ncbi:MAG: GNAT family N-acetyltransferase [Actinomycetota bacterium]